MIDETSCMAVAIAIAIACGAACAHPRPREQPDDPGPDRCASMFPDHRRSDGVTVWTQPDLFMPGKRWKVRTPQLEASGQCSTHRVSRSAGRCEVTLTCRLESVHSDDPFAFERIRELGELVLRTDGRRLWARALPPVEDPDNPRLGAQPERPPAPRRAGPEVELIAPSRDAGPWSGCFASDGRDETASVCFEDSWLTSVTLHGAVEIEYQFSGHAP